MEINTPAFLSNLPIYLTLIPIINNHIAGSAWVKNFTTDCFALAPKIKETTIDKKRIGNVITAVIHNNAILIIAIN